MTNVIVDEDQTTISVVAVWISSNRLLSINVVTLRQAQVITWMGDRFRTGN